LHHDPVPAVLLARADHGGAEADEAVDLGVDRRLDLLQWRARAAADLEVEVHPVLRRLRFRHPLDEDARAVAVGVDDGGGVVELLLGYADGGEERRPGVEAGRRWLRDVAERRGPEPRRLGWVGTVEG